MILRPPRSTPLYSSAASDVYKRQGAVRDSKGKLLETCGFPTSAENLIDFVGKQEGEVRVLIEECELAGWVYRTLLPHAKSVEVSDPRHNAWIARGKRKSDPIDAAKLSTPA